MLINENVLGWFLLIICKEYTLTRSTNHLSRNLATLRFGLRKEGRQMINTEQFPYQTDKSSNARCSMKKLFLKISQYFSTWKATPTQMFFYCETFTNIIVEEHLVTTASELTLEKDCLELYFGNHFQNHLDSVILQKYQLLSNQSFKQHSAHMPSLNLTPTPPFEPRLILNLDSSLMVTTNKVNACNPWTLCLKIYLIIFFKYVF